MPTKTLSSISSMGFMASKSIRKSLSRVSTCLTSISVHTWMVTLLLLILLMNVYIVHQLPKKSESFCNCFGAKHNGSPADPEEKSAYGGYCYDKDDITALYQQGAFEATFAGV